VVVRQVAASLDITPSAPSLGALGATVQLAAAVRDARDSVILDAAVSWQSRSPLVATVGAPTGLVTAVANGSAWIVATDSASGLTDSTLVTVQQVAAAVYLTPAGAASAGGTANFTAEVRDANDNVIAGAAVAWTSSNENIGTIAGDGTATPVASGQTTIAATSDGVRAEAVFTVGLPGAIPVNLWAPVSAGTGDPIIGVWATNPVHAVTQQGRVLRFDGATWVERYQIPATNLFYVWGVADSAVVGVGADGSAAPSRSTASSGQYWSSVPATMSDGRAKPASPAKPGRPRTASGGATSTNPTSASVSVATAAAMAAPNE